MDAHDAMAHEGDLDERVMPKGQLATGSRAGLSMDATSASVQEGDLHEAVLPKKKIPSPRHPKWSAALEEASDSEVGQPWLHDAVLREIQGSGQEDVEASAENEDVGVELDPMPQSGAFELELDEVLRHARAKIVSALAKERNHQVRHHDPLRDKGAPLLLPAGSMGTQRGGGLLLGGFDAGFPSVLSTPCNGETSKMRDPMSVSSAVVSQRGRLCLNEAAANLQKSVPVPSESHDTSQALRLGLHQSWTSDLDRKVTFHSEEGNCLDFSSRHSHDERPRLSLMSTGGRRQSRRSEVHGALNIFQGLGLHDGTEQSIDRQRLSRRSGDGGQADLMADRASKLQKILSRANSSQNSSSFVEEYRGLGLRWPHRKIMHIVRLPSFEAAMSFFIILNAITIGLSADLVSGWHGWTVIDGFFTAIFTFELIVRWAGFGVRAFFCSETSMALNWLDFILVLLALAETVLSILSVSSNDNSIFVFSAMRILRLLRIGRILRLGRLQLFNELMMILDGAKGGLRTFMWSQMLIALFLYVVALIFRELLGSNATSAGSQHFSTLSESFFTVFRCLVANDCNDSNGKPIFVAVGREHGWYFAAIYCVATLLVTFGLYNVIVAIYVENTVAAARNNEMRLKQERLNNKRVFEAKMCELLDFILVSGIATGGVPHSLKGMGITDLRDVSITTEMLEVLESDAEFREILRDLDVADEDQHDLFDTLDANGSGGVDLEELVHAISKLRGDARRSDIVSVGLMVRNLQEAFSQFEAAVMPFHMATSEKGSSRASASGAGPPPELSFTSCQV